MITVKIEVSDDGKISVGEEKMEMGGGGGGMPGMPPGGAPEGGMMPEGQEGGGMQPAATIDEALAIAKQLLEGAAGGGEDAGKLFDKGFASKAAPPAAQGTGPFGG